MTTDYPSDFDARVLRGEQPDPKEIQEEAERRLEAQLRRNKAMSGYYRLAFALLEDECPF